MKTLKTSSLIGLTVVLVIIWSAILITDNAVIAWVLSSDETVSVNKEQYKKERCTKHNGVESVRLTSTEGGFLLYFCKDHTIEW